MKGKNKEIIIAHPLDKLWMLPNNMMYTYEQVKDVFSYFYPKSYVLTDGVSTTPLDIQVFKLVKIDFVNNFLFLKFAYILLSKIVFRNIYVRSPLVVNSIFA